MAKGLDYHDALGLTKNADDIEIKRCFRRLALKYHPDINKSEETQAEFSRICEAYYVLSDRTPNGPAVAFDLVNGPLQVFMRFFGTNNPFEALNSISNQFEAMTTEPKPQMGKQKVCMIELSLEEIYHGCLKKVSHSRKILSIDGSIEEQMRELTIDVKPGLPDGTRFVFEGEGNQTPTKEAGQVVFVLQSKAHPTFVRSGPADLVHKVTLPLYQALVGTGVEVKMLDGRVLHVPITEIVTPGYSLTVPGEGMPRPGSGKGTLVLNIDLLFPAAVSETQKMLIRSAFFLPSKLSSEQTKAITAFEKAFKDERHGWSTGFVAAPAPK